MSESNIFEIHLKALAPISITEKVYGILYKTYKFIPAWTMWNSFVKLYALINWDDLKNEENYTEAQEKFKNIRLTNFYPVIKVKENNEEKEKLYFPFSQDQDNENTDNRENIANQIDESNLISSDLKVSIDPLTNTSEFGQLYEREYLTAKKFIGWIKVKSEIDWNNFWDNLKNKILFIGADKNTGFGKVIVEDLKDNRDNFYDANSIVKKLENYNFEQNDGNKYLFPPEVDVDRLFPLVLRKIENKKGSGVLIEYIKF